MIWMSLIGIIGIMLGAWITVTLNQRKEIQNLRRSYLILDSRYDWRDQQYRNLLRQNQALQVVVSELQKGHPYR